MPYWFAFNGGFLAEVIAKIIRLRRPPHFTRYAVALIGRPTCFSIARARAELGWEPRVPPLEGLSRTFAWYADYLTSFLEYTLAEGEPTCTIN